MFSHQNKFSDYSKCVPKNLGGKMDYPYVVVRYMATVYGQRKVIFTNDDSTLENPPKHTFVVEYEGSPYQNCTLRGDAIDALVKVVVEQVEDTKFRMCVVASENLSLYVERGGVVHPSGERPSGGAVVS